MNGIFMYEDKRVAGGDFEPDFGFVKDEEEGVSYVKKIRRNRKERDYVRKLREAK